MKALILTALLSASTLSFAADREPGVLSGNALISDGDSHELLIVIPDVPADASLKAKLKGASVLEASMVGHGLARVRVLPKDVSRLTTRTLDLRTTHGEAKNKILLDVDVLPGPAGTLRVTTDPPVLPGSVSEAQVRITFDGNHPMPEEARGVRLQASSGTVGEAVRMPDGSFVARYTAPSKRSAEMVVISASDVHYPDELLGAVVLPVHESRTVSIPPTEGASHILRIGERTYGPFQPQSGKIQVRIEVDPRFPMGRLEVTPDGGETTESDMWFMEEETGLGSLHFFPLPDSIPEGSELQLHVLALGQDGLPISDAALLLGPHEMENLGSGVYRKARNAPLGESSWVIRAFMDEVEVTTEIPLTSPLPSAPPLSRVQAVDRPVSHVLIWPLAPLIPGQEAPIRVVAVDEWGLPIANAELALGVPSGDGLLPPSARTDRLGMADLTLRVGSDANPIVVRIGAEGLSSSQALAVNSGVPYHPAGDREVQDIYDTWWNLAADGSLPRRARFTQLAAAAGGPATQSILEEEAPPKALAVRPEAENGFQWRFQLLNLGRLHVTFGEPNSIFPESVRYTKSLPLGIIGLDGGASWEFKKTYLLDFRGQVSLLNQGMPAEIQGGFPSDIQVGVIHKRPLLGWDIYGGIWGQRFDALVARYVSRAGGNVALPPIGIYGGRVGLGVERFIQGFTAKLELAETFAPWPINLAVNAGIELPSGDFGLPDGLHFSVDYSYNYRQMEFSLDGYDAEIFEGLNGLKIGVGGRL